MHIIGREPLEAQYRSPHLVVRDALNAVGHTLEIAVIARATLDVDHVYHPRAVIRLRPLGMPLHTPLLGSHQVAALDTPYVRACGYARHSGKAAIERQGGRIDMQVYVAVFHNKAHAQRPDDLHLRARVAPRLHDAAAAQDVARTRTPPARDRLQNLVINLHRIEI